jgi:lipopolysaccharide assembly protein A
LKYLMWLLNAAIFFVLFAFALNNQASVTLHLFFGAQWDAPLILVLLITLLMGVFLGVLVMVPLWLRARKARRKASRAAHDASTLLEGDSTLIPDPHDPRHGL